MKQVTLHSLACIETESWTGPDNCRLEVFVDGVLQPYMRRSMNDDQKWDLNKVFKYKSKVEVKLWDEDTADPNDYLGGVQIGLNNVKSASVTFNLDDANYKMSYSVIDIPDEPDLVGLRLQQFEASSASGKWPKIKKSDLIADMKVKLANSFKVNQGPSPLCGPAAILFELIRRQPARYVAICKELFETGCFTARTKIVKASSDLLNSSVRSGVSVADWMVMATLRDNENAVFDVEAGAGDFATGLTTGWEMKTWIFELLGFSTVEYDSTLTTGEIDAIYKAKKVRDQGGVSFLLIHAAMVGNPEPTVAYPNHWVSYLGNLNSPQDTWLDTSHVSFNCYSWGANKFVNLGEGPFEDYMFGVVTGLQ